MTLTDVHVRLSTAMLLFLAVAGIWGLVSYFLRREVSSSYWGILAIGEVLIIAQMIVGAIIWIGSGFQAPLMHLLYGAVLGISIPGYFAYTKGRDDRRSNLSYGLICLFLVGISLRAMDTAPGI